MSRLRAILFWCVAFFLTSVVPAGADWTTDSGYAQLSAELGAALPTGAGIIVLQSEAEAFSTGSGLFLPQPSSVTPFAGNGNYTGKTFTVDSALGGSSNHASSHADTVGSHFYGNSGSVAPGITNVHVMQALDFYNGLVPGGEPQIFPGSVQNHSWIGSTNGTAAEDNNALRALDFMIDRDGVVTCVPLNNGTGPVPVFLANSYHAISVGLRSGLHSSGGSTADGTGRMKPDLVVNETETSYASPAVASSAAMLRQAIKANYPLADRPQVIKAILLAGASKSSLPAWHRAGNSAPYDSTFGAGELNVLNAWHILAKDSQTASGSTEVASTGWNFGMAQSATTKRYFFSIPAGSMAGTFSVALTWHRQLALASGDYSSTLPTLSLKLYAASSFVVGGAPIDQSSSTLDNVQHLFQYNLPAGQYALEVTSNTDNINYGLAWQSLAGAGPIATVRVNAPDVFLDLANLDPYVTYTVQQSSDLIHWSTATTVLTSATTPSTTATWQDSSASLATPKFYRLQWTALR